MSIYKYKAIDKQGVIQKGAIIANNKNNAFTKLQDNDLSPIKISEQHLWLKKLKTEDILLFFLHVSFQLKCGAYIDESIDSFIKLHSNDVLDATLIQISEDLKNGEKISSAFAKHYSFNTVIIGLLRAAESTGNLTETISNILKLLQFQNTWKKNIKGILAYPIFITLIAVIILFVSTRLLGPQVIALIKNYSTNDVPILTSFTVNIVPILANIFIGFLLISMCSILICLTNRHLKTKIIQLTYLVPVISKIAKKITFWQMFKILHIAYVAKLDFFSSFDLAYQSIAINAIKKQLDTVKENIINGHKIAVSFSKISDIPTDIVMAIFIGEEGNNLEQTFEHIGKKLYTELIGEIKSLGDKISIVLTLFIGLIFVLVLCSLFQPIYNYIGMAGA